MKQNNRQKGSRYEEQAAAFLAGAGYQIIERNFRCRTGEIDIIAKEASVLVFAEVKYREGAGCGAPAEAVDRRKQKKIADTARYYLLTHGYGEDTACRFDVVAILGLEVQLYKDAFWS